MSNLRKRESLLTRRIVTVDAFPRSLEALGSAPETASVVKALVLRATSQPENAPMLRQSRIRAVRSHSYGRYPALRLFYWFDAEAVYLLYVEPYDELL